MIEEKQNFGHFVSVQRQGKVITYFNSYGAKWDTDWRFIPRLVRIILGQNTNDLTRLFKQAEKDGFKVEYNKKRLQKLSPKIMTCGRWVVFWRHFSQMGYTLSQFQKKVEELQQTISKDEAEIAKDEAIIAKDEAEITELKAEDLVSKAEIEELQGDLKTLKQSENVLKIKTRDLSRSVDRRNKDLVQGYDLFQERILQEVADNKRELSRLLQKKENRENQLRLMKILMLETQKKREIEKRNNRLRAEKTKQSMKKVYEQMREIQSQEQEAEIAKLKRHNHREISKYSKALETLKADNLSLQSQVEEHDARSEQRLRDHTKQIPLTMTMEKPRVKTPRKLRKKGSQMAHNSKGKRSRGKRVRVRSHKRIR
mgnify:CR=1 FL=1